MTKLALIKRVITPTKRASSGAKKNLLKRDGIASDGDGIKDDDSSSLSERQEKEKSKSKKKFSARSLFRRMGTKSGIEDGGYESDASTGSTRSTSSSFLRYQNRAIWKAKFLKKIVLQRRGDGTEAPVQEQTKPWPLFEGIYKRQNNVGDDADGDDEDDDDSISSMESGDGGDCPLAPPAPMFTMGSEEEECVEEVEVSIDMEPCDLEEVSDIEIEEKSPGIDAEKESQEPGVLGMIKSLVRRGSAAVVVDSEKRSGESQEKEGKQVVESAASGESREGAPKPESGSDGDPAKPDQDIATQTAAEDEPNDHHNLSPKESSEDQNKSEPQTPPVDLESHPQVQTSGIPTSETPKENVPPASALTTPQPRLGTSSSGGTPPQGASLKPPIFPTQKLNQQSTKKVKPPATKPPLAKPPVRPKRQRKKASAVAEEKIECIPTSIPRTISYSLRSAIGDGSARQRNSHSLMERRPLRPNGCALDTSYWSHKGRRNYMEDRFVIEHVGSTSKDKKNSKPITLLAVFDGHGGSAASQFCSDWLSSYIRKKNEHFPNNLPLAMKSAFMKVDSDFVSSGQFDGTTACACIVAGKKVICCNSGDSRAIIVKRDGSAFPLSEDHKPDRNDETKRINDLGGRVIHWGRWRVEGVLAVSRSIGDAKLKPYVTAEPDIVEHDIGDDDMFLVVASDGVWDTMSSDLVAKFVLVNTCKIADKRLEVDDKLLRWVSRQVSKRARENGSSDNTSVIVANLSGKWN